MELDAWTSTASVDPARRRRLTIGYAIGAVTVAGALTFVTLNAHGKVFEPDDSIDVELAKAPIIDAPDPEPEPEKPRQVQRKQSAKRRVAAGPPKGVPDNVPAEADPGGGNPYDGDLDDAFDGEGGGPAAHAGPTRIAKVEPKRLIDKTPPPVRFESESAKSTRPTPVSQVRPSWSRSDILSAYGDGVRALAYRCLVTAQGALSRCSPVNGHPSLDAGAMQALQMWRYQPASFEGRPVSQWTTIRLPFRPTS